MELLVRLLDKENKEDTRLDAGCTKRGDVIVARPDGWSWGDKELEHDFWMIVKIPGLPESIGDTLTMQEVGDKEKNLLRKRMHGLNFDKLTKALKDQLTYPRKAPFIQLSPADIQGCREQKKAKANPFYVGPDNLTVIE